MKTELSIEESQRLIDLGVDPKLVSKEVALTVYEAEYNDPLHPVFTLADVIEALPKMIGVLHLNIDAIKEGFTVGYVEWADDEKWEAVIKEFKPDGFFAPELIDALYQLLCWYLERKPKTDNQ